VSDEPARGRLEGERGQRAVEVRFMEGHTTHASRGGVGPQPGQGKLVGHGEQHQGVRVAMPATNQLRVREGEFEGRVSGLAGLGGGW